MITYSSRSDQSQQLTILNVLRRIQGIYCKNLKKESKKMDFCMIVFRRKANRCKF